MEIFRETPTGDLFYSATSTGAKIYRTGHQLRDLSSATLDAREVDDNCKIACFEGPRHVGDISQLEAEEQILQMASKVHEKSADDVRREILTDLNLALARGSVQMVLSDLRRMRSGLQEDLARSGNVVATQDADPAPRLEEVFPGMVDEDMKERIEKRAAAAGLLNANKD